MRQAGDRLGGEVVDHRPQVAESARSGARVLVCGRCNRFLGLAGGPNTTRATSGLAAAAKFIADAQAKSAH